MSFFQNSYISWILLVLALTAWSVVGYFVWTISDARALHITEAFSVEEGAGKLNETLRLHSLARDTKDARVELETLVQRDAISIVEAIEKVGDDAPVDIKIGQVLAESSGPAISPADPSVRTVGVAVEIIGSFAGVMQAAALLYSLAIPSTIDQMQFERLPAEESTRNKEWRLVAHIQVLTTADISS